MESNQHNKKSYFPEREKNVFRELIEKYICMSIIENEILKNIEKIINLKKSARTALSEKSSKSINSINKNINGVEKYKVPSLFQYWIGMLSVLSDELVNNTKGDLSIENLLKENLPSFDSIIIKYQPFIKLLEAITIEDDFNHIIENSEAFNPDLTSLRNSITEIYQLFIPNPTGEMEIETGYYINCIIEMLNFFERKGYKSLNDKQKLLVDDLINHTQIQAILNSAYNPTTAHQIAIMEDIE